MKLDLRESITNRLLDTIELERTDYVLEVVARLERRNGRVLRVMADGYIPYTNIRILFDNLKHFHTEDGTRGERYKGPKYK